ncbi:Npun_R1517 family heterocyst differentiation transcriptional regulator [Leptothoe kymatousa]|uniref:Npun_R1517 family heterocyst differentiation transcriptional regulator n=1 Tax=Leptothoe kymatousa TAU-MAC 1615 TaxID=2364775 RepID=A0ABS5Y788_9CYAN|nr:Npun_R1517 family heterocyst differentiation transcriptional regulator [Leptothoe kymatousa]MBT9313688.1 Npun_R1517 family heterocyst differentiation transcriptional regulator [Leptothoe kymatousa TAU-MAC 1615]
MGTPFDISAAKKNTVNIYECEVRLKFRIIEEKLAIDGRDDGSLVESLVDAYTYGEDEYFESLESQVNIHEVEALEASPAMRRQLIRLRNSDRWD